MNFESFIGNKNTKAAVMAAFAKNRVSQAIIIEGEKGTGKRTFAKLIANAAVCENGNNPCGVCKACIMAKAGSHPDIKIEEGTGVTGNISVDSVRNIIEDVYKKPEQGDINVYMLFVKNQLPPATQNKLLKIIEEPPGRGLFIITIESAHSLLPTIISRATCYTLSAVSHQEAAQYLVQNKNLEYNEAFEIAQMYGGNIGRMLEGSSDTAKIAIEIAKNFDNKDHDAFLSITYPLIKSRDMFSDVLKHLSLVFRDAYSYNMGKADSIGIAPSESKRIGEAYRKKILLEFPTICLEYSGLIKKNLNMNLLVTDFCAKLRTKALG